MNFLFSCVSGNLVPTGFKLKWSEQTGFDSTQLKEATSKCLLQTSLDLQKLVLRASHSQLTASLDYIFGLQHRIPSFYWSKGMKNYQFIFNQCTLKHQKKLTDIAAGSQLKQMFPTLNLSSKLTCTLKSIRDFPVLNTSEELVAVGPSNKSTLGALAVPRTSIEESIVTLSSPQQLLMPSQSLEEEEFAQVNSTSPVSEELVAVDPSHNSTLGALAASRTHTEESIVMLSSPQ